MQTNTELPNQRWLASQWQNIRNLLSFENIKNELASGIGKILLFSFSASFSVIGVSANGSAPKSSIGVSGTGTTVFWGITGSTFSGL